IGKALASLACLRNERENTVEMVLQKVLKQARGHSRAEICIGMRPPFPSEAPHFVRVMLDMIRNADDRLPTRIQLALGSFRAWENLLRFSYGVGDIHVFSISIRNPSLTRI